jgi:hypothetical protein
LFGGVLLVGTDPDHLHCCAFPDPDASIRTSLNRAIIYSAKLIQYYERNPAKQLSGAILQAIDN